MTTIPPAATPSSISNAAIQPCRYLNEPMALYQREICLLPVSKNLRGRINLTLSETQACEAEPCQTLKTLHALQLSVASEDCDGEASACLNGGPPPVFAVPNLVHALIDDGFGRGPHTGDFFWAGECMTVIGELSGMTNVGTHRNPVFDDCQRCNERGVMEGRLVGRIVRAQDERLINCCLTAVYRLRFEATDDFDVPIAQGQPNIFGTLEGAIVCPCD
ncbi:MAG: hypothetical protein AAGA93_03630 [Actinomycetota bacterium]